MRVEILAGISGSGKSTYAASIPNARIVSADLYFTRGGIYAFDPSKLAEAHGQCLRSYVDALQARYSPDAPPVLIVDNTNTTVTEIAPYAALAAAYGVPFEVRIFASDVEACAARNVHNVPRSTVEAQARRLSRLDCPRHWRTTQVMHSPDTAIIAETPANPPIAPNP